MVGFGWAQSMLNPLATAMLIANLTTVQPTVRVPTAAQWPTRDSRLKSRNGSRFGLVLTDDPLRHAIGDMLGTIDD